MTVAEKPPELELLDSMYIMPGVPFSSCSMGVATACDTVVALAPGYDALIFTTGGVICGYWSIGRRVSPMNPTMTMRMEMTIEKTGWSMKKFTFMAAWGYCGWASRYWLSTFTFMPGDNL